LLVLAIVLVVVWRPWRRPDPLAAFANLRFIDSVAVLPIENRTGDDVMAHLSAGITDEIVGRLKQLGAIKVSDPYSVERLLALELTARQLADSLGVEKLVYGALYSTTDGIRLNLRVSSGASGETLSTWRYEWNADYRFDAALNLAQAFVDDYADAIPLIAVPAAAPATTHSPGHEAYLIGRASLGRRTAAGLARARTAFRAALALDSAYADAYAGLSNVYALSLAYRYKIGVDGDGYRSAGLALAMANRAIELDPDLADGYTARGYLASRSFAPVGQVASDCRRAIDLEPSAADVLSWCARVLNQRGDVDAAIHAAEQAIALDPQNAGRRLALAYDALARGLYDRAADEANLAGELQPELMLPRAIEARAHLLAGRAARCAEIELGPHAGLRATCLHELGQQEEASAIIDSLAAAVVSGTMGDAVFTDVIRAEDLATYYAWVGNPEAALEWVRRAYNMSPSGVEPRVLESALFDRAQADDTFRREVDRIRAGIWERVQRESEAPATP
jgi:TolB-like protein